MSPCRPRAPSTSSVATSARWRCYPTTRKTQIPSSSERSSASTSTSGCSRTDGIDFLKLRPVGRLGYLDFVEVDSVFTMERPTWG